MILISIFPVVFFLSYILLDKSISLNILNPQGKIEEKENSFTFISTGDVGLGRYVNYMIHTNNNPNYPFEMISNYLNNADFVLINLESSLTENCPIVVTGLKFCGKSTSVRGLVNANVKAASLSNNHTTNYGLAGLNATLNLLRKNQISAFGIENEIEYLEVNDVEIALLGFVELGSNWSGLNNATDENIINLTRQAKENSDVVITAFHWGKEYTHNPSENQKRLARLAIDNGSDLVLGNHPHWIQPVEIYNNKHIVYAQGNTVFDQDWSLKTREGVLYKFEFKNDFFKLVDTKYTIIENNSQPRFADTNESENIKSYILD